LPHSLHFTRAIFSPKNTCCDLTNATPRGIVSALIWRPKVARRPTRDEQRDNGEEYSYGRRRFAHDCRPLLRIGITFTIFPSIATL